MVAPAKKAEPKKEIEKNYNYLTNFSNGMATFSKYFPPITEPTKLSIPIKKRYLSDAVATIAVRGGVVMTAPPSFAGNDDKCSLSLNPASIQRDMITKLSGAEATIVEKGSVSGFTGRITGLEDYTKHEEDYDLNTYVVGLMSNNGEIRSFQAANISSIRFTCPQVQAQIAKALDRNYRKINQDSESVDISLSPKGGKEAIYVQYTLPTSAWQSMYQLRLDGSVCILDYAAKVDNPTDDDIKNTIVSVAVGDPISFETDLADIRLPRRQKVYFVKDEALGRVNAATAFEMESACGEEAMGSSRGRRGVINVRGGAGGSGSAFALAACSSSSKSAMDSSSHADKGSAGSKDVGDFAIFTAETPIDIGANRSAVVPLLSSPVEGRVVLLYNERYDKNRPYRSVKFTNTAKDKEGKGVSLGYGLCTVYCEEEYAGQVEFFPCKPGETQLLPHARENGVMIWKDAPVTGGGVTTNRVAGIVLKAGVAAKEMVYTRNTVYNIKNSKEEAFQLEIEHNQVLAGSAFQTVPATRTAATDTGVRIPVSLEANKATQITVTETSIVKQEYQIVGRDGVRWIRQNIIEGGKTPLVSDKNILAVLEIQDEISKLESSLRALQLENQTSRSEQDRKMKLIQGLKDSNDSSEYTKEVKKLETRITQLDRDLIPATEKAIKAADEKLDEVLRKLTLTWGENLTPGK